LQQSILLTTTYFVPDHMLLDALKGAARRGVDVRVLVPWQSNHVVTDWIAHSYFTDCLQGGIRIFGYRYTVLHAKTCTIDGQWSTVGTCNLDRLSLVGNYEINLAVYNAAFAQPTGGATRCVSQIHSSRLFCVAFMLAATPAVLLERHQQASDVTEMTCGATSHYTARLLQSCCATRGI
jgi:phosphatidylserine/phosphatidylglycerophosphate/cardiolipin synthase-like enzyme